MPRYDKPFTEEEIDLIFESVSSAHSQAERDGDVENVAKFDELLEKLGFWS